MKTQDQIKGVADKVIDSLTHDDRGAYGRLLAKPAFTKLWVAQFISGIGDWLIIGILIPTVTALSGGSSTAVAGILIVKIIPALFLSSVTGILVDHFDRRKIMITADLARLALVLILLTTNSLAAIYLVVLLMETASLFFWPARNALIPAVSGERDINVANSLMYTTQQVAMVVGLAASGAILAGFEHIVQLVLAIGFPAFVQPFIQFVTPILVGSRAGYALDSLTFILSATLVWSMKGVNARPKTENREPLNLSYVGASLAESFRFMKSHVELRGLLVTIFFAIVGGGAIVPVGLDYITRLEGAVPFADRVEWIAKFSGSTQTFVLTFLAIGMVIGAILVPKLQKRVDVRLLFPTSVAIFGVGMLGFALTSHYFVANLFATVAGLCISMLTVSGNNYIVSEVEDGVRGRVFTALESVIRISLLISMIVVAPFSDLLSTFITRVLGERGITHLLGLELSGPRITLIISAMIVFAAAGYGYRKLYFQPKTTTVTPKATLAGDDQPHPLPTAASEETE